MKLISQSIPKSRIPCNFLNIHHTIVKKGNRSYQGIGVSSTKENAHLLSKYELLERLAGSFSFSGMKESIFGNKELLKKEGNQIYDLNKIKLFHESQVNQLQNVNEYTINNDIYWIECKNSLTGKKTLLPSSFIFFDHSTPFFFSNSAGSAIHTVEKKALISAVYELIEKSTIAQVWYLQKENIPEHFSLKEIQTLLPLSYHELLDKSEMDFRFYRCEYLSTNTVICICKFKSEDNTQKIAIGSSCNLSLGKSIRKSIDECIKNVVLLNNYIWLNQLKKFSKINKANTFLGHFLYFNNNYNGEYIPLISERLKKEENTEKIVNKPLLSVEDEYIVCQKILAENEILQYQSMFNHDKDVYHFIKLFSPSFLSLSSNYKYPYLGNLQDYGMRKLFTIIPHIFP